MVADKPSWLPGRVCVQEISLAIGKRRFKATTLKKLRFQDLGNELTMHIGEPDITPSIPEGDLLVIQAHLMEHVGMEVVHRELSIDRTAEDQFNQGPLITIPVGKRNGVILLKSLGIRIADHIHPVARKPLAKMWRGQQPVNLPLISIRTAIRHLRLRPGLGAIILISKLSSRFSRLSTDSPLSPPSTHPAFRSRSSPPFRFFSASE